MEKVNSYNVFKEKAVSAEKAFLLLYKTESEQSECALHNLNAACADDAEANVFIADVNEVRDIHPRFGIKSVPSLLIFSNGEFENTVKGCHDSNYYKALIESAVYRAKALAEGKVMKHVTVYSTPTCSWCNTLKSWLRKNHVAFTDIDVSRDEKASEEMIRLSGQKGVPQTKIEGQIIVGFNQPRLKELLGIQ